MPEDAPENPYSEEAAILVADAIEHSISFAASYHTIHSDPGRVLLEAIDAYDPLAVDIDVDEMSRTLSALRAGPADKAPRGFTAPDLDSMQERFIDRSIRGAAGAGSAAELGRLMDEVERDAEKHLGTEAARPVLIVTAFLEEQYRYFTSPEGEARLNVLASELGRFSGGEETAAPRFLQIRQVAPNPPPNWGNYYNPGTWWEQTLSDTRDAAEVGAAGGAGVGCAFGALVGGVAGCGGGVVGGGAVGGALGVIFGGTISGILNYLEARHDFSTATQNWCAEQQRLAFSAQDEAYPETCFPNSQQ